MKATTKSPHRQNGKHSSAAKTGELTDKQIRFVGEYLLDLNATRAYRDVYGAKQSVAETNGPRLLGNARVSAAVAAGQKARSERTGITQDRVLEELGIVAFSDIRHYAIDAEGAVKLVEGAPDHAYRAISSVKSKRRTIPREDKEPIIEVETELRFWSKPDALRMSGQHLGMFTEKVEHSAHESLAGILTRSWKE